MLLWKVQLQLDRWLWSWLQLAIWNVVETRTEVERFYEYLQTSRLLGTTYLELQEVFLAEVENEESVIQLMSSQYIKNNAYPFIFCGQIFVVLHGR